VNVNESEYENVLWNKEWSRYNEKNRSICVKNERKSEVRNVNGFCNAVVRFAFDPRTRFDPFLTPVPRIDDEFTTKLLGIFIHNRFQFYAPLSFSASPSRLNSNVLVPRNTLKSPTTGIV